VVLAQGDGTTRRRHALHETAGITAGERQDRLHLGVLGERLGGGQVDRASAGIELEAPLSPGGDLLDDSPRIPQEERCRVHEHAPARLGHDVEAPVHGRCKGVPHGLGLRGIVGARAELIVRLHEQHPRPDALGREHVGAP
jgi:hypothetical protein